MASDAVMMDSNVPIYSGLEAIRKATEMWYADTTLLSDTYAYGIDIIEVSASGDLAYVRGHSQMSYKSPDGIKEIKSKWVDIWKKSEEGWKCILNIGELRSSQTRSVIWSILIVNTAGIQCRQKMPRVIH